MAINNPEIIKKLTEKIKETDWKKCFQRYEEDRKRGQERTATQEYFNWFENFIKNCKGNYDDESFIYETLKSNEPFTDIDKKNERDLSYFYQNLQLIANEQRVKEYYNTDDFEEYGYVFKYNEVFYEWTTIVGQGSITYIQITNEPEYCYIDVDKFLK